MCGCFGIPILQQFVGFVAANMPAVLFVSGVVTSANLFIGADLLRRRRIEAKERKAFTPPAAVCIPSRAPITARVTLHNDAWWAAHGTPVITPPPKVARRQDDFTPPAAWDREDAFAQYVFGELPEPDTTIDTTDLQPWEITAIRIMEGRS